LPIKPLIMERIINPINGEILPTYRRALMITKCCLLSENKMNYVERTQGRLEWSKKLRTTSILAG
jgi:hypothetical protein